MTDPIIFERVDRITTGAVGQPGQRVFLIQAERGASELTVLVEKEQVAMLAARVLQLLTELEDVTPDEEEAEAPPPASLPEDPDPLFRARMMRLGYDPERGMVMLELFEDMPEVPEDADPEFSDLDEIGFEPEGYVARVFATRGQMRMLAIRGAEAVASGRPLCRLCMLPMDPAGHDCPSRN